MTTTDHEGNAVTAPAPLAAPSTGDDIQPVHVILPTHGGPDIALCGEDVRHLPVVRTARVVCAPCEAALVLIRAGGGS